MERASGQVLPAATHRPAPVQREGLGAAGWGAGVGAAVGGLVGMAVPVLGPWIGATVGGAVGAAAGHYFTPASGGGPVPQTERDFPADPNCYGGSYGAMKALSLKNVREADHAPPKSTYRGTPYAWVTENMMPAVSIAYGVHRGGVSGGGGGVSTTGSSWVVTGFRDEIHDALLNNDYVTAMCMSFNDQKNAAPNTLALVQGQTQAAEYARSIGLLANDHQLAQVLEAINRISY